MKTYFAVEIFFKNIPDEEIVASLWKFSPLGVLDENEKVSLYFQNQDDFETNLISDSLNSYKDDAVELQFEIRTNELPYENWNEEWEKSLQVIHVTDRIVIKPTFREYAAAPYQIVLTIDPKMSFGTGEHQTTKLVLKSLEIFVHEGMEILDVGTGTAILAIAAVKLGASHATALDNDDICFENGIENVRLNNVEQRVEILTGTIDDIKEKSFDLITANIQKNVLLEIAEEIIQRTKKDGIIILSGLLIKDELDIRSRYEKFGAELLDHNIMDEWLCLIFKKNI